MNARLARLVVGALLGAAAGGALGYARGGAFVAPIPLDAARWSVLVPGRDANIVDPRGRGTGVTGDVLELVPHVFSRADVVVQRDPRPFAALHVALDAGSGPLVVHLRHDVDSLHLALAPGAVRLLSGAWRPVAGPLTVTVADGRARIGDVDLGPIEAPTLELSALDAPVRLRRLTLLAEDGTPILDEDPAATWPARAPIVPGAAVGLLAGAAAAIVGPGALVGLALPLAVAFAPHGAWLALVERLYLVRATPWGVANVALALAFLPLLVQLLAVSGRAMPEPAGSADRAALRAWGVSVALTTILASRALAADGPLAPVGLAFLLLPLAFARAARLHRVGMLARDLPAHLCVATFGWGVGLLPALAWRLVVLVAGAGTLLRRAPRVASDAVFVTALALVPAAEIAVRASWLSTAWDAARLEGETSWRDPKPFWEEKCGPLPKTVLFAGGSSTGGAFQFNGDPTAFFPSHVHARLCAAGLSVRTLNNGDGGRDSFTVSRSVDTLLAAHAPAVVVLYLGVNDLLTAEHTLTRAQREAAEAARGSAARGLDALGRHSRLVTGLALLARPAVDPTAPTVPNVPLADAEANLRRVAAATHAAGAKLLLLQEHTAATETAAMAPYGALEARLAAELPDVAYVDLPAALAPYAGEGLLVDRNHLSRRGSARVSEAVAPAVAALLGFPGVVPAVPPPVAALPTASAP